MCSTRWALTHPPRNGEPNPVHPTLLYKHGALRANTKCMGVRSATSGVVGTL